MAAGKWKAYDFFKKYLGDGTLDLDDTTNWKLALFLSTSNANTLSVGTGLYGDLTNEHANANGYTTGGITVTNITWVRAGAVLTFDADNVIYSASGGSITARFGGLYKNATVNTIVKPMACMCLLEAIGPADVTATTGNTISVNMHASGLFNLSGMDTD